MNAVDKAADLDNKADTDAGQRKAYAIIARCYSGNKLLTEFPDTERGMFDAMNSLDYILEDGSVEQAGIDENDIDMFSVAEIVYREDGSYEELGEYDHAWGPGQTNLPDPV